MSRLRISVSLCVRRLRRLHLRRHRRPVCASCRRCHLPVSVAATQQRRWRDVGAFHPIRLLSNASIDDAKVGDLKRSEELHCDRTVSVVYCSRLKILIRMASDQQNLPNAPRRRRRRSLGIVAEDGGEYSNGTSALQPCVAVPFWQCSGSATPTARTADRTALAALTYKDRCGGIAVHRRAFAALDRRTLTAGDLTGRLATRVIFRISLPGPSGSPANVCGPWLPAS